MRSYFVVFLIAQLLACQSPPQKPEPISSPDGTLQLDVFSFDGELSYSVWSGMELLIDTSRIQFVWDSGDTLGDETSISEVVISEKDTVWETVWGEQHFIRNQYRELLVKCGERNNMLSNWDITFRLYNDGLGFRTAFPGIGQNDEIVLLDERSEFKMTGDHTAWWIPADYDSYEYLYNETLLSDIDTLGKTIQLSANTIHERHAVNTPITMETENGWLLSIHEAALLDYSGMTLRLEDDKRTFVSSLVPNRQGSKVIRQGPFHTPWRTIQIARSPKQLVESNLIVNLNEPHSFPSTTWITPSKYIGIWWSHHLGSTTWGPGDKQGATTENTKRYIDFAARHFFPLVLVEGWNQGWEWWFTGLRKEDAFDFTTSAPNFDLQEVSRYAETKGVELMLHHETYSSIPHYESQLEDAMALAGQTAAALKTGYVGPIIPEGEFHHGQYMVNHYTKVMQTAANHEIMLAVHEPIKPTGLRRTFPNLMAAEGLRGSEFNSPGGGGNPPSHLTIVPFTRMLAGPIDYTPGLVQLQLDQYRPGYQVPTTVAYQLASMIVVYSPLQMASDLIEHYQGHPALQFIMDLATDWEESLVLDASIGEHITIARRIRDRRTWFIGSLTNEEARTITITFDFLEANQHYMATIYADGPRADFENDNMDLAMSRQIVVKDEQITLRLARGGGAALRVVPVERAPRSN